MFWRTPSYLTCSQKQNMYAIRNFRFGAPARPASLTHKLIVSDARKNLWQTNADREHRPIISYLGSWWRFIGRIKRVGVRLCGVPYAHLVRWMRCTTSVVDTSGPLFAISSDGLLILWFWLFISILHCNGLKRNIKKNITLRKKDKGWAKSLETISSSRHGTWR